MVMEGPSRASTSSRTSGDADGWQKELEVQRLLLERRIKWQERRRASTINSSPDLSRNGSPRSGTESPLAFKSHPPSPELLPRSFDERQGFLPKPARAKLDRASKQRLLKGRNGVLIVICFALSGAWLVFAFTRYSLPASFRARQRPLAASSSNAAASSSSSSSNKLPPYAAELISGPQPSHSLDPPSNPLPFTYPPPSQRRKVEAIEAHRPLTANNAALDEWIAHGRLASTVYWPADHPARKHDVLFSWVNGSDWEHARALDLYAQPGVGRVEERWAEDQRQSKSPRVSKRDNDEHRTSKKGIHLRDVGENRFREIDELRYAVRSAATNLQDLGTIQVLSPSFFPPRPFDIAAAQPPKHAAPVDWEAPRKKHSTFLTEDGRVQWGQVPGWVNLSHPEVKTGAITSPLGGEHLRFQHDWQVWTPNWLNPASILNPSSGSISGHVLAAWKQEHLPTFNSIAFESMLGAPVTPSSRETFVYANDDMFFTSPLTLSDFTTPLLGPVLRFDPTLLVRGHRYFDESSSGEWPSLSHSAWLLDRRFGTRVRPYTVHDPRTFDTRVLREMRMMWAAEWRATGEDRFRSERLDRPGTSTHFMMAHYFVERFREAALWSYLVLRLDKNDDGLIDASEMAELLISLRLPLPDKSLNEIITSGSARYTGSVLLPHRSLFEQNAHLSHLSSLSLPHPRKTTYKFMAQDGAYPFMTLHPYVQSKAPPRPAGGGQASGVHQVGEEPYPRYHAREGKTPKTDTRYGKTACRLDIAACLSGLVRDDGRVLAQDLFKLIAFEKGEKCGDCLLVHLLGQSGQRGLNAFLPPQGKVFPPSETAPRPQEEPHLPLTPTYFPLNKSQELSEDPTFIFSPYEEDNNPNFSSASVSSSLGWAEKSQRDFALRLLQRYSYVIGSSPSRFHRMEFEASTAAFLDDLSIELGTGAIGETNLDAEVVDESEVPAFVCLNDDYGSTSKGRMRALFEGWARKTFPARPAWEEDGGKQM